MSSFDAMGDFLQQHAYQNVWCTPNQDKQSIIRPVRITPEGGTWKDFELAWRRHNLPDPTSRYHIYQIGQIHPLLIGLAAKQNKWLRISDVCKSENLIVDVYTQSGVQLMRTDAYYRVTQDRNLIMAVKIPNAKIPVNLDTQALYFRLYTNAYFNSTRANSADDVIHVHGIQSTTTQSILDFQILMASWRAKSVGHVYCFKNGLFVHDISLVNTQVGDYIEFVYDGSIKRVIEFAVGSLSEFTSTMDQVHKYLLHYPGATDQIDYHDDVDFFLVKPLPVGHHGVYYHKNNETAVRMVTHKDYSVPTQYLHAYAQARPELSGVVENLKLVLHIRKSGYLRPLVQEHQRIKDLYTLPEEDIVAAMVGINATVSVWKAAALEASGYTKLMRSPRGGISRQNVQDAYGYNAVSVLLGDTPFHTRLQSGQEVIDVPVGLGDHATSYEYDANGHLLDWHDHVTGSVCTAQEVGTKLIEMIYGTSREHFETWNGVRSFTINPVYSYRYYTCGLVGSVPDNQWVDVTGTDQYAVIDNVVTWLTPASRAIMVRSNRYHVTYRINYMSMDGLYTFMVREWDAVAGTYRTMHVPPGKMDLFLNGRSLIEGLDYIVAYPRVMIINKEYLNDPRNQPQNIVVRLTGFCQSDLKMEKAADVGYVQYGVLSYNNRYDVRNDRVNRIVLEGALYRYDEFTYAEEDYDVHVVDVRNGAPYAIQDIVVPMNDYLATTTGVQDPTATLRALSQSVDKEVSDYMTVKLPQKRPDVPSAIANRYQVVSPFFNRIIYDLVNGNLWDDKFTEHYSDNWVREQCGVYEYLLQFDPLRDELQPDDRFVVIHPHNLNHYLDLGIYQYRFLGRVHALYGRGLVDLSGSVRVQAFT